MSKKYHSHAPIILRISKKIPKSRYQLGPPSRPAHLTRIGLLISQNFHMIFNIAYTTDHLNFRRQTTPPNPTKFPKPQTPINIPKSKHSTHQKNIHSSGKKTIPTQPKFRKFKKKNPSKN